MNHLQNYLDQQKDHYARQLASDPLVRLGDIKKAVETRQNISFILDRILKYSQHLIHIYCRLQISNIEGEILSIIQKGDFYEDQSETILLKGWSVPDRDPAFSPPVPDSPADSADYQAYCKALDAGKFYADPRD